MQLVALCLHMSGYPWIVADGARFLLLLGHSHALVVVLDIMLPLATTSLTSAAARDLWSQVLLAQHKGINLSNIWHQWQEFTHEIVLRIHLTPLKFEDLTRFAEFIKSYCDPHGEEKIWFNSWVHLDMPSTLKNRRPSTTKNKKQWTVAPVID